MQDNTSKLTGALKLLLERMPEPPDANCSCHISSPCNDCVDHYGEREAFEYAKDVLAEVEADTQHGVTNPPSWLSHVTKAADSCEASSAEKIMAMYHRLKAEDPSVVLMISDLNISPCWAVCILARRDVAWPAWAKHLFGKQPNAIKRMFTTQKTHYIARGKGKTVEEACLRALEYHNEAHGHA